MGGQSMASSGVMSSTMVPGSSAASMASKRWYFPEEKLQITPSVRTGQITLEKELSYRQQAANFIQDMGQRLQVTQLCINTAIVYMQRFYMFHSFTKFHRNYIAAAALFLAAKVEEQPRKLEHVIKVSYICLHRDSPQLDSKSEQYLTEAQELVSNENILLQTLGFDVAIDHPHTHVVKCCQLVKASKELAQTSYFMATNSLHLTTMCLRYPPTIVACVCIHLACKWSNYKIPLSAQGKEWFSYVDASATSELLESLTTEFLTIFERCPSRLKKKIMASTQATKDEEDRRARTNKGPHEYTLNTSDIIQPPHKRPKHEVASSSSSSHRHHHNHGHSHHGHHHRSNSGSSSTSGSNAAGGPNNIHSSHANKHVDPRSSSSGHHGRTDKSHSASNSKTIPSLMSMPTTNPMMPGMKPGNQPNMMGQQQQAQQQVHSNHVDQYGRPKPQHSKSSSHQHSRGHPSQPHHSSSSRPQPQMQPQQQQQHQMWPNQGQANMDGSHRSRQDMSLYNQQPKPQQQRPHQPSQPQHNSRHSLPNDWTVKAQRSHHGRNAPPLPPSEPPKPA